MTKFRIQVIITSLLISSLGIFLGGCAQNCAQNDKSLFSQLNGQSINIKPNNQQSMSRWIITNIKTEPNIHNQLSYLESCISKQFHLNLKKGQHIPFEKNEMQYLDPNPEKKNEIKLLSNGKKGSFYVTWAYTNDQKQILKLYRKLWAIPSEHSEIITGRTTDYEQPINLSIEQVRNIIQTAAPSITNKEKSMIKFLKKSDLKLYFNAVKDIFPELGLFKNQAKYSFKDDGALGKNINKPVLKLKWYNLSLMSLLFKDEITEKLKDEWFDYFNFYIKWHKYADEDSSFIYLVCDQVGQLIPELTFDFYKYFSLSHTKLIVGKKVPVQLYFKDLKWKISFNWTIKVKGYDKI